LGLCHQSQIRIVYSDREEVLRTGDLYYLPSGHTAIVEEDFESVEFMLLPRENVTLAASVHRCFVVKSAHYMHWSAWPTTS
jgi:hypothetical protein